MIEAMLVKSVTYLEAALDLVGFDEGVKNCAHSQRWRCGTAEVICNGQDGANIICRGWSAQLLLRLFAIRLT